ncbi:hypothetical protein QE152_g26637 [Popillia japonica]|uniref:Uncharacterized protein n=1 Tax=Popillia japonica TaxID=7064 RepID=A0AAW1JY44_POPJA
MKTYKIHHKSFSRNIAAIEHIKVYVMEFYVLLLLTVLTTVLADSDDIQAPTGQVRQFTYNSQYPVDLQYDFSLLNPQLQYPQFSGTPRVQPQVFIYPGGTSGQPFLLQPGAPPGNFLIPQPQPGFVLRDVPATRPDVFVSGYPKPAYVPPINKDAEEIPTSPGMVNPTTSLGRKPEKLETFDEKPEIEQPTAGEVDVLASADRTLGRTPSLKPGHRFFILNGQPLFSNYPLPQFANSPFQPSGNEFAPVDREFYTFRQHGPPFLPEGFSKQQSSDFSNKGPLPDLFVRNSVTGQINGAKQHNYQNPQNEIRNNQNFVSLNQRNQPTPDILFKTLEVLPYRKQNYERIPQTRNNIREGYPSLKLTPIEVPDAEDENLFNGELEDSRKDKESITVSEKPEAVQEPISEESPTPQKAEEPSISRSQPNALALAGPGGIAAAAPRATALTGEQRGICF